MNAMAPTRPAELHACRVRLAPGPAAAAEARGQVRAAIRAWEIPVDPDVAVLLASELVTNAIGHETGETIVLAITCSFGSCASMSTTRRARCPCWWTHRPMRSGTGPDAGRGLVGHVGRLPHPRGQAGIHARVRARSHRRRRTRPDVGLCVNTPAPHRLHERPGPHAPRRGSGRRLPWPAWSPRPDIAQGAFSAMSIRELTLSFLSMCETCVAMVRRDSSSRAEISGFDGPSSTNAAILIFVAVRLPQPLCARRCCKSPVPDAVSAEHGL